MRNTDIELRTRAKQRQLLFQFLWMPEIILIEERDEVPPDRPQSEIESRSRSEIVLSQIPNRLLIASHHLGCPIA